MFTRLKQHFHPLNELTAQREKLVIPSDSPAVIQSLLDSPLPEWETPINQLDYLIIDFETTGINATSDRILSVGYLTLSHGQIDLQTARHNYICDQQIVNTESVTVNHIVPSMLTKGEPLDVAMEQLFTQMQGKILLVHGAMIEKQFIDAYLQHRYNIQHFPYLWLDTLRIEKHLTYNTSDITPLSYQLNSIRQKYALPNYPAHNALIDALSTGELFLAQINKIFSGQMPSLFQLGEGWFIDRQMGHYR